MNMNRTNDFLFTVFNSLADLMSPSPGSLVASVDPAVVMSSGVMTPPPGSEPQTPVPQGKK